MKKNIAVVYGGYSSEHDISVKSGKYVASVIDRNLFEVFEIHISKDSWIDVYSKKEVDKSDFSLKINDSKIKFDAIVSVIHGNPGENGILQSYFDLMQIPYTGCNAFVSGLTFNKYYCNYYLKNFNVNVADSIVVRKNEEYEQELENFINKTSLPVFIKPSAGGSSFGTTKVKEKNQIKEALNSGFEQCEELIIEKFIKGTELTCGIVKTDKVFALTPVEIRSKHEFFDYESKYNSNLNEEIIPAQVDDEIIEKIKKLSEKIYEQLNCNGIVRIDYIVKDDNKDIYFLEVNSIPGMTSESIVPKMLRYDKINITELYTALINKVIG